MDFEAEKNKDFPFETTKVGDEIYNVEFLEQAAEHVPVRDLPLETLSGAVAAERYYWIDGKGNKLGPFQILKDWESAKRNPDWRVHVETIERANVNRPIWITRDGEVFNGMHRLTKAFIDGVPTIKAKIFDSLPGEAIVE